MSTLRLTTPDRVREVIGNPDPVLRNLQITQSYHELAAALHELLGGPDVLWCSFAVWASKQAGSFIRNEEVPAPLRRFLGLDARVDGNDNGHDDNGNGHRRHPAWTPSGLLRRHAFLEFTRTTVSDVSAHVAEGNRLVYAKLAPIFADFLGFARQERRPDPPRLEAFLERIFGDPTTGAKVRRAFRHYYRALFETDTEAKAELIFLANALIGWHEQIRLQEAIDGALSAPIRRALEDPERRLLRWPLPGVVRRAGSSVFRTVWRPAIRSFEDEWKRVATECMMSMGLPDGGRLDLGEDLPSLEDGSMFPPSLSEVSHREAPLLLGNLDQTPNSLKGSAARDWSRLEDRMNYIVDYFRSRQQSKDLLRPPYETSQVEAIRQGRLPSGRL